jgi:cephalosporin-C deacetylase-like acetyl esterase
MLHRHVSDLASEHWKKRSVDIAALRTPADVAARQKHIRDRIMQAIGGFPERTRLNPKVTGVLERDGYRVEKLIYESQPRFFVTANLYVPASGTAPYPAVLGVAGHSETGKSIDTYQYVWISLAKRGFIVLAFDPPGQGERSQYWDAAAGKSKVGIGTREHTMAGIQCLLSGTTYARHETWDGIRGVDYLLTRPDVDPKRIGVAGNSGGGTQAAYLAVLEPRLAAAVSSCYITSWEKLWFNPGPQDAEQNFPNFIRDGLDFGDFLTAFAPRPILMETAIRDYFPIDGARATYAEVQRIFGLLGAAERAGYFEYDDPHGWSKPRREALYRWMAKWLQNRNDDGIEPAIKPESEADLRATATGQVATSLGGETVQTLNATLAERLYRDRTASRIRDAGKLRPVVTARLAMTRVPGKKATSHGEIVRDGYKIEKLTIESDPGIQIPALLFVPSAKRGRMPALLWLHGSGKAVDAGVGGDIEQAVRSGHIVLAADVRGTGEGSWPQVKAGYSEQWRMFNRAMLIGKPLLGMQVADALAALDILAERPDVSSTSVMGKGNGGVVALYAAALEPRIAKVAVEGAPTSYMQIVRAETHEGILDIVVPGVLRDFDLPDLERIIAPRPLKRVAVGERPAATFTGVYGDWLKP